MTDWTYRAPGWVMTTPSPDGCLALAANVLYYRQGLRPATMLPIDGSIAQDAPPTAVLDWYADRYRSLAAYLDGRDVSPLDHWLRYWHTYTVACRIASVEGAYIADYGNDVFLQNASDHTSIPCGRHGCGRPLELLIWLAARSPVAREILAHE